MRSKFIGELTMSHLYLLGVATLTLTSASFAGSDTNADLQARLEAAEARISELSAVTNANWLNDTRADEVRGLVHDVLADADTRASLQGSGATAGYNGGFTVGSADGNWSLKINGLLQSRWYDNSVSTDDGSAVDVDNRGFETSRASMQFSGTLAGDYGYDLRYDYNTNTLDWAYGSMDLGDGWALDAGRMRLATNREWIISDGNQMAIDRSNNLNYLSDTSTGVNLTYTGDDLRFWFSYANGQTDAPTGLYTANDNSTAYLIRGEFMLEGSGWSQFDQFTSADGGAAGTLIGLTYWDDSAGDNPLPDNVSTKGWVVDAQLQFGGSNLYAAYTRHSTETIDSDPNTFTVAYGLYLDTDWEVYARYQDSDPDVAGQASSEIMAVGVNYYMAGNNAKWSLDYCWTDDAITGGGAGTANQQGWVNSTAAEDQSMLRMQLQFMF